MPVPDPSQALTRSGSLWVAAKMVSAASVRLWLVSTLRNLALAF
jgi:hypothetical protein